MRRVGIEGRRVLAEGREAVVHEWDDGLVLRVARSAEGGDAVARATLASEAARHAGVRTPAVVETVEVEGRPAQLVERVDGPDLFAHLDRHPFAAWRVATLLGRTHAKLHGVEAPAGLPPIDVACRARVEPSRLVPDDLRAAALTDLDVLPAGDSICHGDFHPGNLLLTRDGPVVIDWTGATRGPAVADLARTLLLFRAATLPPGTPAVIVALAAVGRRVLRRRYERAYRRVRTVDDGLLARWLVVQAADRLAEGIDGERAPILRLVDRAHLQVPGRRINRGRRGRSPGGS